MKLDIKKWNEVRKQLEAHIKATKHSIRKEDKPVLTWQQIGLWETGRAAGLPRYDMVPNGQTYRGGSDDEYSSLKNMKWDATTLYAVRAACRGRQHCADWTIEDAKEKILPNYALPEDKPADPIIP